MARDAHGRFIKGSGGGSGGAKVTVRDLGANALLKRLHERGARVTVGIHEDVGSQPHKDSDLTIAEVAAVHELGLGRSPRRSFIADYVDENEQGLRKSLEQIGHAIVKGTVESPDQGLARFGVLQVGEIQQRIRAGIAPELADETIERKGSDTPLIDSGEMWGAIASKVETD